MDKQRRWESIAVMMLRWEELIIRKLRLVVNSES
jgi:hypothetical protein